MNVNKYLAEVLLTEEQIQIRVAELGSQISDDYASRSPLLLGILKGSVVFLSDLMRHISVPHEIDFLAISSYGKEARESSGAIKILKDLNESVAGKDLLIVEDIIDSGLTINYLIHLLRGRIPASLKICTLLNKPARRVTEVPLDYVGFDIEDRFVFGYGLDIDELFRNLPFVGVAKSGL